MANKANLDISEKLDISCRKGDTFELFLNFKDSANANLPLLTGGYDFFMQVRGSKKRSEVKGRLVAGTITKGEQAKALPGSSSVGFSFEEIDDLGNVTLKASAATMRNFEAGRYSYDLQYTVGEKTTTVLKGTFTVNEDISTTV